MAPPSATALPRPPNQWLKTAILTALVLGALALAGYAVWYNLHLPVRHSPSGAVHYRDFNLAFTPPREPWVPAEELRARLGAPAFAVYQHTDQITTAVLAARNYENREPRADELQETLVRLLRAIVEPGTLTQMPPEDQQWMGLRLGGFRFRAQSRDDHSSISGQAYFASYKGVGYWFIGWTSESWYEERKADLAQLRACCQLLQLREQWRPTLPSAAPYKNVQVGYTFVDPSRAWKEETDEEIVKGRDPHADKFLTIKLYAPGQRRDLPKEGFLLVYVLPEGEGEPLQIARQYVERSRQQELQSANPELKVSVEFQERTEPPEGEPPAGSVEAAAPVLRLRSFVKNALNQNRLHVLSAIRTSQGKIVALHAWCDWNDRFAFEQLFIQIVSTLRPLESGTP